MPIKNPRHANILAFAIAIPLIALIMWGVVAGAIYIIGLLFRT